MSRLVSSIALFACVALLGGAADAKPCRDAHGKFIKCPPATSSKTVKRDAKGKCHGANGKFVACPK
jgi:hypothetical protein